MYVPLIKVFCVIHVHIDIDECEEDRPCDPNAECTNVQGSFSCSCPPGFSGDGLTCRGNYDNQLTLGHAGSEYAWCNDYAILRQENKNQFYKSLH